METISPELALVDEQLKARGRQALCDFPHRLAAPTTPPRLEHRRRPPGALVGGALLAAVLLGVLSAGATQNREATAVIRPTSPAPARTTALPSRLLRWRSVSGAVLYNVILWRDGERVLDLWPRAAAVRLPTRRLTAGEYQWFVYPVRETRGKQQFGRLTARGTVRV
ncbi:MAG: hypothetical protein M3364_05410 [Actinomycetota bacterium]|nr:hypothetical protein [Actinomycetota bacterium]